MTQSPEWRSTNALLDVLPDDVCRRLESNLQPAPLEPGQLLYETTAVHRQMHFPRSGVVSLLYVMDNGDTGEIAMVGNEGVVGIAVLMDSVATPTRAEVQLAGEAWVLRSEVVEDEIRRGGAFHLVMLRYTQLLLSQMAQAVICSRHHAVEKQLGRWLLLACDRAGEDRLKLTQERIAGLLGVRREAVSEAAGRLQAAGLIQYTRGNIRLADRRGLEANTCGCYAAVRDEQAKMMRELRTL